VLRRVVANATQPHEERAGRSRSSSEPKSRNFIIHAFACGGINVARAAVFCLGLVPAPIFATSVQAADASGQLPLKSPSVVAPAYDWTGFYVGGHVGYSRGKAQVTLADQVTLTDPSSTSNFAGSFGSLNGGAQAGYNYLLPSRFLLGIEADASFPNFLAADDVAWSRITAVADSAEKIDYMATLRGRLGYAFPYWMIYATGGFAWSLGRFLQTPGIVDDRDKVLHLHTGWAVGAGTEVAIASSWTARLEYLYWNFVHADIVFSSGTGAGSSFDTHTVRVGLNYKIGSPAANTIASNFANSSPTQFDNWNIHGQMTLVGQGYRHFPSSYEGPNSLSGANQARDTGSATAFIGFRPWEGGELYFNPELMQGFGLSDTLGVAGFPNGEAQKSNFPMPRFNMARMFLRQTFGLGGEQETIEDGPNQLAGKKDVARITVTVGKFAVTDIFDGNAYANDPRTTFLNWNIYGGGSYDWTMDKLSWTWGAVVELNQKHWAFRVGYFLLPVESNANIFDTHIPERGQYTAELELRYSLFSQPGKLRLFGWMNQGSMGSYADALAMPTTTPDYPDITLTRRIRTNYGFVGNIEQAITDELGVFSRASWSPGLIEIMGWTDCDSSFSLGTVLKGTSWRRPDDRIGVAGVVEGLSPGARAYFAAGGLGILIGDGNLNYRKEKILEAYYAYSINKWAALTFDYQFIVNPGYNADRGPVSVFAGRLHAEF
jgi:high affinity Mn2+ porin